ncbi:MAG: type II toxin-antitoxin system VapC family toxin [Candidatus Helarchaeota archaeon]
MGIFLDTGFFLGLCHPKDPFHENSKRLLREMSQGTHGLIYSSPYIIAEASTLLLIRTHNHKVRLQKFKTLVFGSKRFFRLLPWSSTLDAAVFELFQELNKNAKSKKDYFSFIDASTIFLCRHYQIEKILSYDSHLDRVLTRIS